MLMKNHMPKQRQRDPGLSPRKHSSFFSQLCYRVLVGKGLIFFLIK